MNTPQHTTQQDTYGAYNMPATQQAIVAEVARTRSTMVECRECNGLGVIAAGIDPEAGRDPGRDCWRCNGYGEHIR